MGNTASIQPGSLSFMFHTPPEMLNLLSPDILKICTDMIYSGYSTFRYIIWKKI